VLRLTLEAAARLDAVQVTVNVDLEHGHKVEFIDKRIDSTHRIVFGDPVVQPLREKHRLISTLAFDESLQGASPQATAIILPEHCTAFSHKLGRLQTVQPEPSQFGQEPPLGVAAQVSRERTFAIHAKSSIHSGRSIRRTCGLDSNEPPIIRRLYRDLRNSVIAS